MTADSERFERRIQRIHELIEASDSQVTWNDRLPDPDNQSQSRQIDISIKRGGKLTLVECRLHKSPQDVKWIEELIGRRISLLADAVIAVSSSGFTKGAILKARAYGVILRDLQTLTVDEIKAWGKSTDISLTFFEFLSIKIQVLVSFGNTRPTSEEVFAVVRSSGMLFHLFQKAVDQLDRQIDSESRKFNFQATVEALKVGDAVIDGFIVSGFVRRIVTKVVSPSVVAYDSPEIEIANRATLVEKIALGDFEITHSSNNVCIAADLGAIVCPPSSLFAYFGVNFGRAVTIRSMEVLRPPPFRIALEDWQLAIAMRHKPNTC